MPRPLVSILIPTYEPRAEHLRAALQSLRVQTFTDWIAFVHDDASTIDVRAMAGDALKDSRIAFERNDRHLGIGGNWNACLRRAKTPYVQFLFQDDVWEPTYLEAALGAMETNPPVALLSVHHVYRTDQGAAPAGIYTDVTLARTALAPGKHAGAAVLKHWLATGLKPNIIGEPSFVMLRRTAVEAGGPFLEDMPQFLDSEYWTRLLTLGDWYYLAESLGTFRVHAASASARNEESGSGVLDRFRTLQRLIRTLPDGELRSLACRKRSEQLQWMIAQWLERRKSGRGTGGAIAFGKLTIGDYGVLAIAFFKYFLHSL